MPFDARELLARIIQCEAGGEGVTGMQAVATVIMNRVHVAGGEYLRTGGGNFNPFSANCEQFFPRNGSGVYHTRINQHCFYRPTSLYWET